MKCQNGEAPASVHGIKRLLEVDEDAEEWPLLQMGELLCQFRFNYPRPSASSGEASMQAIMELDPFQPEVHHLLHNLPNWFKEADAPIFPTSFWD
jgi:hypothetical protein